MSDWTLMDPDWLLLANKTGATRLAFALTLKFFERESRFPRSATEFDARVVAYVAEQTSVDPDLLAGYEWAGRTATRHRTQIREAFGFRSFETVDEERFAMWLAREVLPFEPRDPAVLEALLARVRSERVEPPARLDRILGTARARFEADASQLVWARLGADGRDRLAALVADGTGAGVLAALRADPGPSGLDTLLDEVSKLQAVQELALPSGLLRGYRRKSSGCGGRGARGRTRRIYWGCRSRCGCFC